MVGTSKERKTKAGKVHKTEYWKSGHIQEESLRETRIKKVSHKTAHHSGNMKRDQMKENTQNRVGKVERETRGELMSERKRMEKALSQDDPLQWKHQAFVTTNKKVPYQLTAAGFLSVQKLPLRLRISISGNVSFTNPSATSVPCSRTNVDFSEPQQPNRFIK